MNNAYTYLSLIACGLVVSCNSQKTNSHNHTGGSHSHDDETYSSVSQDNYFGFYILEDANYGTNTKMTVTNSIRTMVTNSLPNHKTGEFPRKGNPNTISAQNKTYTFPVNPKYTGKAQWVREPGIAINGVKFEPQTAEVVICDTGENYRIEAIQDVFNLGLDFNHAHVQPTGAYHYHGTPTAVIEESKEQDLVHIGFAHDGFPMYYSKKGTYKSSFKLVDGNREGEDCTYTNPKNAIDVSVNGHHDGTYGSDYEYTSGYGDLDECNGVNVDGTYMYLVTNEFPYVGRCLMGEVSKDINAREGRGSKSSGQQQQQQQRKGNPSFIELLKKMDSNKDGQISKNESKGPLRESFSKIDTSKDGFISEDEFKSMPKLNNRQQGRSGKLRY